ncbi:SRPBCC family protein [Pseudonocardia charpentierae]|uniref:SRPBCC family protein n=1 Tax=Pseudonocardia charpentierae TaxID=3075545 RepID=A0ABU2N7A2_9PSEU|nr:SRPBCC family protein [Pseudonocardia sp. DSM 45834]MDT0349817.1 SRPBCC family protein [Pseudonocardia sp. DSM 45834]
MTVVVQRSIDIDAPASTVWAVVSDVERWPEWTASISSVKRSQTGPLAVGERVVVAQPRLPTLTYTVTEVDEGRSFTWSAGSAVSRGVGEHVLAPRINGGCTATLRLTQRGPGARFVGVLLDRITRRYLRMEAEGLKARSEREARAVH